MDGRAIQQRKTPLAIDNWPDWTYNQTKGEGSATMKKEYMPLYVRIKADLINRIAAGELKKGGRLPPERALADAFRVSRITVVGALRELEDEGIITKIRGSGSYVNAESIAEDCEDVFSHIAGRTDTEISFGIFRPTPSYFQLVKIFCGVFQLENPGLKVRPFAIEATPNENADPFLMRIGAGEAPTVGEFFLHADYSCVNGLVPLERLPGYNELEAAILPQCVYRTEDAKGDMHVHAISLKVNCRVVLANARLLREAGVDTDIEELDAGTLADWVAAAGAYTKAQRPGFYGIMAEIPNGWHNVIGNMPYLWGDCPTAPENSPSGLAKLLERPQCRTGLAYFRKLVASGNPAPFNGLDLFATGRVGLIPSSGTWPLALWDLMADKFEMRSFQIPSQMPHIPAASTLGNACLGIFRSSVKSDKELEAAWKWIKFLFRRKQQFAICSDFTFPALKDFPCPIETHASGTSGAFIQALGRSIPQFDFKNIRSSLGILGDSMKGCLAGKLKPEACIAEAVGRLETLRKCKAAENVM